MSARKNIVNQRFSRLLVIQYINSDHRGEAMWQCRCDCGTTIVASGGNLRSSHTTSCGCWQREQAAKAQFIHGEARSRITNKNRTTEYECWRSMRKRCFDPNCHAYKHYGGRGITICDRWLQFENFLADMGRCPPGLSLDRIDNDGNYEPNNCRWATRSEQQRNKRRS